MESEESKWVSRIQFLSAVGTFENSPAVYCWVVSQHNPFVPKGRIEIDLSSPRPDGTGICMMPCVPALKRWAIFI